MTVAEREAFAVEMLLIIAARQGTSFADRRDLRDAIEWLRANTDGSRLDSDGAAPGLEIAGAVEQGGGHA